MTTAYMIAEAYQHRTAVEAGREWTYQDIPARIIKVTNVKYVRQAHARRNEWMVYFDISENDRREGQTGSTTRMEPVHSGSGPRFFANHHAASKALILDGKTQANRDARQDQVRAINRRRDEAINAARRGAGHGEHESRSASRPQYRSGKGRKVPQQQAVQPSLELLLLERRRNLPLRL